METNAIITNVDFDSVGSYYLLDTSVIAESVKKNRSEVLDFLEKIAENGGTFLTNDFVEFEFTRGCKTPEQYKKKQAVLESLNKTKLPFDSDVSHDAVTIANIYSNKNVNQKQISLIDCLISSFLKKYSDNPLMLITLDNYDYPICLHDRVGVYTIAYPECILNIGLYKFNTDKFDCCEGDFNSQDR